VVSKQCWPRSYLSCRMRWRVSMSCWMIRCFSPPSEPFFDPRIGRPLDADGAVSAVDVFEVSVSAGL
jgi:hypothetical protein